MSACAAVKDRDTPTLDPKCAKPSYPTGALHQGQEGTVLLELLIDADGVVRESAVLTSSGYPRLDSAAQEGVHRCTFAPKVVQGKAVKSVKKHMYTWKVEGSVPGAVKPPPAPTFDQAPPALRPFLIAARKADTIVGPLKRCLAYPDLPGNQWRPGLAQTYCKLLFDDAITLKQAAGMVDRGALAQLDALFRRDLALHFSKDQFSEIIHRNLLAFDDSDEAARVTRLWVERAPDSPFANAARGAHMHALAKRVRGGRVMGDTPRENFNRMTDTAAVGYRFLSKAVRLEPRLIAAHVSTIGLAMMDSEAELEEAAFRRAAAIDPGCHYLVMARMKALSPRWGGSFDQTREYAAELSPLVSARPLLAIPQLFPLSDAGSHAFIEKDYGLGVKLTSKAALIAPSIDLLDLLGKHRVYTKEDRGVWETLVALLEASRFSSDDDVVARELGRYLVHIGEPEWARKPLMRAVELDPDDANAAYMLGRLYADSSEIELATPLLVKGLADKAGRANALYLLTRIAGAQGQMDKADTYSVQYANEFPQEPGAWFVRAAVKRKQGKESEAVDAYKKFLALNPDKDPKARLAAQRYIDGERDVLQDGPKPKAQ